MKVGMLGCAADPFARRPSWRRRRGRRVMSDEKVSGCITFDEIIRIWFKFAGRLPKFVETIGSIFTWPCRARALVV